jgi:peptide deformylase
VDRPAEVKLRYLGYDGQPVEEHATDLFAVCIQHEMDHLEGVLFLDHLSRLKRETALRRLKKAKLAEAAEA